MSGDEVEVYTGHELQLRETARAGDYLYIPAGVSHVVVNRSDTPALFAGAPDIRSTGLWNMQHCRSAPITADENELFIRLVSGAAQ